MASIFYGTVASAEVISERSVQLSTASAAATNVSYAFEFTVNQPAEAFVVDFCSNAAQVEDDCTAPAGMTVAPTTIQTPGYTKTAVDANTLIVESTLAASSKAVFTLEGVTNPSASGLVYARIVTYDTAAHAAAYQSNELGAGSVDGGVIAFSITDTIGVTASVMESVTFCVSGKIIQEDCTGVEKPVLSLGEKIGDVTALSPSTVSEGTIYAQLSTNAASGVTINLKSSTAGCGGLIRMEDPSACHIGPSLDTGVEAGKASFGVKVAAAADTGNAPTGILQAPVDSWYATANRFSLHYVAGNASGITSVFGDPFLDTAGAPANNKNVALTFGASVANDTPAGAYSADLSLIATGKF